MKIKNNKEKTGDDSTIKDTTRILVVICQWFNKVNVFLDLFFQPACDLYFTKYIFKSL